MRVIQIREVMAGWATAWMRTSLPMEPVEPVRMTCMIARAEGIGLVRRRSDNTIEYENNMNDKE